MITRISPESVLLQSLMGICYNLCEQHASNLKARAPQPGWFYSSAARTHARLYDNNACQPTLSPQHELLSLGCPSLTRSPSFLLPKPSSGILAAAGSSPRDSRSRRRADDRCLDHVLEDFQMPSKGSHAPYPGSHY